MPDNRVLTQRVLARIAASTHSITVHYPPARVVPTGAAPAAPPTTLLNKPAVTHSVVETPATPSKDSVTMQCLWMEAGQWSDVRRNTAAMGQYGWHADTDAMARVSMADANDGDVFLGTDRVTHDGREYKVINVVPIASGFAEAATLQIWLKGAWRT